MNEPRSCLTQPWCHVHSVTQRETYLNDEALLLACQHQHDSKKLSEVAVKLLKKAPMPVSLPSTTAQPAGTPPNAAPAPASPGIDVLEIGRANPGFFVLRVLCDEETGYPLDIEKVPVEFWAIECGTYFLYPITPEGLHLECTYIQYPTGAVERVGIDGFNGVGSLLDSLQQQHKRGGA